METKEKFIQQINEGYTFKGASFVLGTGILEGSPAPGATVAIPLKTLNRHGLIAGATGTGKTVTLQIIAENMCKHGIPVLLMDLKGDLSGIAQAGTSNPKIEERHTLLNIPFQPKGTGVEFLTISKAAGVKLRATVSEFGPVLFAKILDLNETQSSVVSILFKYADDNHLPLLDLKDFKSIVQFATDQGKEEIAKLYGNIAAATASLIIRKVVELEQQGADQFFGEKSFDVNDLTRTDSDGNGIASIIRLTDIQDKPKLFSTFMLCMLSEIYHTFPEAGDLDKPKLCVFIDEAHLIFNEASKALLDQIESIIKLIRSKGVGIYFCTQNPYDIPESVLAQLGLKVQHALRAFTPKDRKAIKQTAENYPISEFYKTEALLTSLGIGQSLITALNEKGIPTPLAAVHMVAPASRMGVLTDNEMQTLISNSDLTDKYNEELDRESAYEILEKKLKKYADEDKEEPAEDTDSTKTKKNEREEPSLMDKISKNTMVRQVGRTVGKELMRGILGMFGVKTRR
jgi:uncharacterized protein